MIKLKEYKDWIHITQLLSLVILGLTIFNQSVLDKLGIGHVLAMKLAFFGLLISLIYEHFLKK